MLKQNFTFQSLSGADISGHLERPYSAVRGWAVFLHCFDVQKNSEAALSVTRRLAQCGIGVLCLSAADVDSDNLICAVTAMTEAGMPPFLLAGHSLAGRSVVTAAKSCSGIKAVSVICLPLETDKTSGQNVTEVLKSLEQSVLIFDTPDIENLSVLLEGRMSLRSFIALNGSDYMLSQPGDADYVATVMAAWSTSYLPVFENVDSTSSDGVIVHETGEGRFQLKVQSGHHHFLADEPLSAGGDDSGPAPYDFLATGLAACTAMTLRMYASHKKLPLERVTVCVTHRKNEKEEGRGDVFERKVKLEGLLDEESRAKLIAIVSRCPVHQTLTAGAEIVTTEAGQGSGPI